jgi:hypothetical protein
VSRHILGCRWGSYIPSLQNIYTIALNMRVIVITQHQNVFIDHPNAEVKTAWRYTSTSPVRLRGAVLY